MNIISLNTWVGRAGKNQLMDFLRSHAPTTDVFCLQEILSEPHAHLDGQLVGGRVMECEKVMDHGLQDITAFLTDFQPFFSPQYADNLGLLLLVKKNWKIIETGEKFVYKEKGWVIPDGDVADHSRLIQYVTLETSNGPLTICNFHGAWHESGKGDTEDRLLQSKNILDFIQSLPHPCIICGYFNLMPDTESIQLFERAGLRNLIKENGVTTTRSSHYSKPEKFADYAFVTPGITVNHFAVLPEEVSDHLAFQLKIS